MAQSIHDADLHVRGTLSSNTLTIPDATVVDADVNAAADITATKVNHRQAISYRQSGGSDVAADDQLVYIVEGTDGTIASIEAVCESVPTGGDKACQVDLKKSTGGGALATVLTGTVDFSSSDTDLVAKTGTISSASLTDGDVLQVVITVSGSTGSQADGLGVVVMIDANPL